MDTKIPIVSILDRLEVLFGDTAQICFSQMRGGLVVKISYLKSRSEIKEIKHAIDHQGIESMPFANFNLITQCIDDMIKKLEEGEQG